MTKTNNISRNLPKVGNTGNPLLNNWLSAADEIFRQVRLQLSQLQNQNNSATQARQNTASGNSGESATINLSLFEQVSNRVDQIDYSKDGKGVYPSVFALRQYVSESITSVSGVGADFDIWEVEVQDFTTLDAKSGDKFRIQGDGSYDGIALRNDDIIEVYQDDLGLKIFVLVDSRNIMKGVHTTDDLDEGLTHLYFTEFRVLSTILENLVESVDEILTTDNLLTAIGKAKGRINRLNQITEDIQSQLDQHIEAYNLKVSNIDDQLQTLDESIATNTTTLTEQGEQIDLNEQAITLHQTRLDQAEQTIDGLVTDVQGLNDEMQSKLNTTDLLSALQNTLPSQTGTYILKAVDGVLSWEEQI